jgi:tRNA(adenine34) deaminase
LSVEREFESVFGASPKQDERFMRLALEQAQAAFAAGETPVGAIAVRDGAVIGRGHNRVESLCDPTAHAEILCLGAAASSQADWRLHDTTLYVTLEPCTMCIGAILLARVGRLVYGVRDERAGACGSRLELVQANPLGHELRLLDGCLEAECKQLLQEFYRRLRERAG